MQLVIGFLVGVFYLGITFLAYRQSAAGWEAGHTDLGFWWAVIAGFLAIAALTALIGTWLHGRSSRR